MPESNSAALTTRAADAAASRRSTPQGNPLCFGEGGLQRAEEPGRGGNDTAGAEAGGDAGTLEQPGQGWLDAAQDQPATLVVQAGGLAVEELEPGRGRHVGQGVEGQDEHGSPGAVDGGSRFSIRGSSTKKEEPT